MGWMPHGCSVYTCHVCPCHLRPDSSVMHNFSSSGVFVVNCILKMRFTAPYSGVFKFAGNSFVLKSCILKSQMLEHA